MTIVIEELTFKTIIGLLPEERITPQRVIINAKFCMEEDDMVLDYAKAVEAIKALYHEYAFGTVEESLNVVSDFLKKTYPFLTSIQLKIIKPDILPQCHVGAILEKKY